MNKKCEPNVPRMPQMAVEIHQNSFGGRAPPKPAGGAYSAPPDHLAGFRGEGRDRREGRVGTGSGGEG